MSRLALLVSLMAATAAAQAEYASHGFKYIGCVEAEPPVFSFNVDLPAPFSAQQCQEACHAKGKYAAIDGSCHCEDPASKGEPQYNKLEDSVCVQPCIGGNQTAGWCGGPQCPVTGKKRYSLYKMDEDHCDDDKDKDIGNGFHTKSIPVRTSTTIKTITSCPPEVTNCPLSCPPGGCHVDPPSPITTWKHHSAPSSEPKAPFPRPECDGEHCKTTVPASPTCPPGGCVRLVTDPIPPRPHPTPDPAPTKVPVTISEGTRYQSGVLMAAVAAMVMAVSWL
ncbi:WSC domain-containing protein [Trichoderma simmonsii]|uniref:WSC domain-containing protein n=1 Tax=Trichoderma simmonsii TaxID=1491479 RepID=A0A8G0L9W0_9HYPO|nr:WSC domain-containing protein [Trichoderma simmonsii]